MTDVTPPPYLRAHSYYGFLESLLSPADLVQLAVEYGVPCLALTDHRYLSGAIEFFTTCLEAGIKPIIGLEVDLTFQGFQGQFTLLAKDREGWANLSRLSTQLHLLDKPLSLKTITAHRHGVIAIAGGERGLLREMILSAPKGSDLPRRFLQGLQEAYDTDLFVEVQRTASGFLKNEVQLINLAKTHGLPLLATQNIFYARPEEAKRYRTLTAIRHQTPIQALSKRLLPTGSVHFPEPIDFRFRFQDLPDALDNLQTVMDRCWLELPIGQMHFPAFPTRKGQSQADLLREKAYAGARRIYKTLTSKVADRLEYELKTITEMGYEPIFLIVEDILNHAREMGIPTSSRGSAASSLVAHCLDITSPDPLKLNLYFERFLNPARKKPPDIDTDIASHRRDEVIQYVFDAYGADRVAMVGTVNRYRPKSALGDVAKAYGLTPETVRQLSKKLPSSFRFRRGGEENHNPFAPLLHEKTIPVIQNIVTDAHAFLDMPRHLSVHPGGIVIAPFPITDLVPLVHSSTLGIHHTQYDLDGIEQFGLVKIDLLGIRGLTVLGEVADRIRSWRLSEFQNGLDVLDQIPHDDPLTSETVVNARTIGCFQIESPGMRSTLREIQAKSVEDIMAALALYRPGPLRGGLRDAFVRRFRGEEEVTQVHDSLTGLLENTLGVILYQEQVLRIAHELGGLTLAEADVLRRAMSHFDPGGVMVTLRQNFIRGAGERRGVPPETAERIWEMMAAFAGYGFPKAHAAS
ncbi:MAG: DNA polymerase III subunit alpha, partial [Chloroflexota bacterium]|nr:DNA polymerase III subunit alpha [Chloroflexota bacterium]